MSLSQVSVRTTRKSPSFVAEAVHPIHSRERFFKKEFGFNSSAIFSELLFVIILPFLPRVVVSIQCSETVFCVCLYSELHDTKKICFVLGFITKRKNNLIHEQCMLRSFI